MNIGLQSRLLLVLALHMVCVVQITSAQVSVADIKLSDRYHWGEANAMDRQEAIDLARQNLVERIFVVVVSDQSFVQSEVDDEYSSAFRSQTRALSRLQLRGLEVHTEQRRDRSWLALAYIDRGEFQRSLDIEAERIASKLNEALSQEQRGSMSRAIPLYFEAYLSTYFHPMPLYTDRDVHGTRTVLRNYARSKITDWLRSAQIDVSQVRSRTSGQNVELYIDKEARDNRGPLEHLTISLNRPGYGSHPVTSGRTSVYLDRAPESLNQRFEFQISLQESMISDADLRSLAVEMAPVVVRTFDIDFSDVVRVNFEAVHLRGNQYRLIPDIQNLSVYDIRWELPAGRTYTESVPTHNFGDFDSPQLITLVLNQDRDLTIRKKLLPSGELVDAAQVQVSPPIAGTTSRTTNRGQTSETSRPPSRRDADTPETRTPTRPNLSEIEPVVILDAAHRSTSVFESIPSAHREHMQTIIRMRNAEQLNTRLNRLRVNDVVQYGNRSAVSNPDQSYIAVINPQTLEVHAILTPVNGSQRTNLRTNAPVDNSRLAEEFRGYGSVWFQFNR